MPAPTPFGGIANDTRLAVLEARRDLRDNDIAVGEVRESLANLAPDPSLEGDRFPKLRADEAHGRQTHFRLIGEFIARRGVAQFVKARPAPVLWQRKRGSLFGVGCICAELDLPFLAEFRLRAFDQPLGRSVNEILSNKIAANSKVEHQRAELRDRPRRFRQRLEVLEKQLRGES